VKKPAFLDSASKSRLGLGLAIKGTCGSNLAPSLDLLESAVSPVGGLSLNLLSIVSVNWNETCFLR
jgi:hypothetical protein